MAPPPGAIPPVLPPSVEEAYRRKCIQLRQRMNEVEESNDAARLRLLRMRRGIEKMRLERAFLLEQLAKRTSTNAEDSEGSPSPPPTPKEKPLRTKRGHRKPSFLTNLDNTRANSSFVQPSQSQSQALTLSPSGSDAFPPSAPAPPAAATKVSASPAPPAPPPKRPRNGFELFVAEVRSVLLVANRKGIKDGTYDIEEDLARKWHRLGSEGQNGYIKRFEDGDFEGFGEEKPAKEVANDEGDVDVEMAEAEVEDEEEG